jgi:hypothetical protein
MGVSSSSQPPGRDSDSYKATEGGSWDGRTSFKQLFADVTTGHRLDDLINQNVGAGGTQQEINLTDDLDSANQDGTVQREEVLTEQTEKGPPQRIYLILCMYTDHRYLRYNTILPCTVSIE